MKKLALLILCLILSACSTYSKHVRDERLRGLSPQVLTDGHAVLFLSSSADQKCVLAPHISIVAERIGDSLTRYTFAQVSGNDWTLESDFKDRIGHIAGFRVEPGEYKIRPFAPGWNPRNVLESKFTVSAGEVVYLGDFGIVGCNPVQFLTINRWQEVRQFLQSRVGGLELEKTTARLVQLQSDK